LITQSVVSADTSPSDYKTDTVSIAVNGNVIYDKVQLLIDNTTYVPYLEFVKSIKSYVQHAGDAVFDNVTAGYNYIVVNGRYLYSTYKNLSIQGKIYIPIRTLAKVFGCTIAWNDLTKTAELTVTSEVITSGDTFYSYDDVYWLSRFIFYKVGNQPLEEKLKAGTIILNRVSSADYPNNIYSVIFDKTPGASFSVVKKIYDTPNEESIQAAKICLEGYRTDSSLLNF
jgi:N-acetylmuramoyl-L-alanine amidase